MVVMGGWAISTRNRGKPGMGGGGGGFIMGGWEVSAFGLRSDM